MPLGIDRTHFYAEKVKKQEKDIRVSISKSCTVFLEEPQRLYRIIISDLHLPLQTKEERIAQLETENAMLYLKLAQLHGTVQSVRQENSSLNDHVESEQTFRKDVSDKASVLQRELEVYPWRSIESLPKECVAHKMLG